MAMGMKTNSMLIKICFAVSTVANICFSLFGGVVGNEATAGQTSVAVLNLDNSTHEQQSAHWGMSFPFLLKLKIDNTRICRFLPDSSLRFAFQELGQYPGQGFRPEQVMEIGRIVEAGEVLWGSYRVENGRVRLNAQLMNVATGRNRSVVDKAFANWPEALNHLTTNFLSVIGQSNNLHKTSRSICPISNETKALELYSRAMSESSSKLALTEAQVQLQSAIKLSPTFAQARTALAHIFLLEEKFDDAYLMAKSAVQLCPGDSAALVKLGFIQLASGFTRSAEQNFLEARQIKPDDPAPLIALCNTYMTQSNWSGAITCLELAKQLAPYDPTIFAALAPAYVHCGQAEKALAALQRAQRYSDLDPMTERAIAEGYLLLNEIPLALRHYELFLAGAKKAKLVSSLVESVTQTVEDLKPRLRPTLLKSILPQDYTVQQLDAELKQRLTHEEYQLIINPFVITKEMAQWANTVAGDARDDMGIAGRLFYGLTRHVNLNQEAGGRTAEEAYNAWFDAKAALTCQDYTVLYIALARHLGLKAYFVLVDQDYRGKRVSHACAGVVLGNKIILVDPAYNYFGVPHQDYKLISDLKVVGAFLVEANAYEKERVALKILQDWPKLYFEVAIRRANRGQTNEAREAFNEGVKIESKNWLAVYAEAAIERANGHHDTEITLWRKCLELNPELSVARYFLAAALNSEGRLKEARKEYRTYLEGEAFPDLAAKARKEITAINAKLHDLRL